MVSPKTKRKATKKGKGTPGRRNGRSASSSPNKKKQNKTTESATTGGMDIDAIAGANGAEAAAAAKADNENVGGKPPDENTTSKEKDKEDDDTPKDQDVEAATKDNEDEKTTKDNGDEKTTKDNGEEETTTGTEDVGTTKGIEDAAVLPPSKVSPHVGDVQDPLAPPSLGQQSQDSYAHRASMDTDSDSDIDLSAIVDSSRKEKRDARIPPDQGGSRRNHTSIEIAVLRRLFFDYVRLRRYTDWDAIEAAMDTYPDLYAMWVTKHAFRFCGTNQQLCRYGERTCEYCPHDGCKERRVVESASHIMVCQDPSRRHALLESTEQLEDWLKAMDTEPSLRRAIVLYLRSYGYATFGSEQSRPTEVFAELSQAQDGIGWQNFTLGRFSTTFRRLMMAHYQNISSDRLASTWAHGLVMRLLQIHHDQWLVRNEFVHEKDEAGMNREEAQALRDNIAAEYLQGSEGLLEDDLYLFETSYEEMLAWPVRDRRQWLLEVESARRCAEALDLEEEEDSQVPIDLPSPRRQSQASNSSTRSMLGRRRRRASTGRRTRARR